jgi:hypothetical protein
LLDDRLSPTERNAWQVFRLLIHSDGVTAFPTYDQLRPYLGSTPGKPASRETIAKTLTLLRLTRWLSLGRRVRDAVNGRVQGNVYILHDEPIGCAEAMEIDRDYMLLIGQSLQHSNKSIRLLAEQALNEVSDDPHLPGNQMPTRLDVMAERIQGQQGQESAVISPSFAAGKAEFGIRTQEITLPPLQSSESELCENEGSSTSLSPSSESELRQQVADLARVRNPNSYSTYTNTNPFVSKSFVQYPGTSTELRLPASLTRLSEAHQQQAMLALSKVHTEIRQSVLDQWNHRVSSGGVANPFGYLMGCVQRAMKGEFNALWQAPSKQPQTSSEVSSPTITNQPSSQQQAATAPRVEQISTPKALERDETTITRGRDHMKDIRQSLGFSRRSGPQP